MPEEIRTNDLIDEELNRTTDYPDGPDWHLKQTLINRGIYETVLRQVLGMDRSVLKQPHTIYSRITAQDVETVRGVVSKVVQEAFANL